MDDIWGDARAQYAGNMYDDQEEDGGEDGETLTIEDVIMMADDDAFDDEFDNADEDDNDEEEEEDEGGDGDDQNSSSFWNSSPTGRRSAELEGMEDFTLVRASKNTEIADDSLITDEDSKALRRAHRRADRIMDYADDLKLIASFHYRKRNFHLVKLLEPIFIIGRRIPDIKGYYFTLLGEEEAAVVSPQIEKLIINQGNDPKRFQEVGVRREGGGSDVEDGNWDGSGTVEEAMGKEGAAEARKNARTSRRKWSERVKQRRDEAE